ncbi:MAG TPA: hypothetical protein VMQ76_10285 [Terracidiphilus sp.]|nr:hypothetical protein [Terracidiphilus sp.]
MRKNVNFSFDIVFTKIAVGCLLELNWRGKKPVSLACRRAEKISKRRRLGYLARVREREGFYRIGRGI